MGDIEMGSDFSHSVHAEFTAACSSAVILDRSSTGKLLVTGADRLDLLHRLSTNSLLKSLPSTALSTVFTTDKGRIIDYARVLVLSDSLLLVTSSHQEDKLKAWIEKYIVMEDVRVENVTSMWSMYSLLGPEATMKGSSIFGRSFELGQLVEEHVVGRTVMIDCRQEQSLASLNILIPSEHALEVGEELKRLGELAGVGTISSKAYECVRIFYGIPVGAHELTTAFNPYDVGLGSAISFDKGCYIGQEVIARLDTYSKIQRKLVRVSFKESTTTLPQSLCLANANMEVGVLTSCALVPIDGEFLALAVVADEKVMKGDVLFLVNHSRDNKGIVTETFEWKRA